MNEPEQVTLAEPTISAAARAYSWLYLVLLSMRRLIRPRQTIVCLVLLGLALMVVVIWAMFHERIARDDIAPEMQFTRQLFIPIYVAFLLPIFCLCFATASVAGEREDETLVYLLITPLPRTLIFAAKYTSAGLLVLVWTMGSMVVFCLAAGPPGWKPLFNYWPAIMLATLAYVGLFLVFSVIFRRATIVAVLYAIFLELVLGNMPGTLKRVAISFYTKCMIVESSSEFGNFFRRDFSEMVFAPLSGTMATLVLSIVTVALFVFGMLIFWRREYAEVGTAVADKVHD